MLINSQPFWRDEDIGDELQDRVLLGEVELAPDRQQGGNPPNQLKQCTTVFNSRLWKDYKLKVQLQNQGKFYKINKNFQQRVLMIIFGCCCANAADINKVLR